MTNGEKIKEIFPTFEFIEETEKDRTPQHQFLKVHGVNKMPYMEFDLGWWNAEYIEPTTRNCYGCKYSKDNHNAGTEECHLCMWENQYTPTTKNDCEHCSKTYGTLGCCDYVNNEPVYSCKEGHDEYARELEQLKSTAKNDLVLIHTEGLDEGIRCAMCTNYMRSDRGCDGNCIVNKDMYKAVMDVIKKSIQPSVTPQTRKGYLSVDDVMSVFDDFMCGEVDEDGTETFLEMLKDKAETPQEPRKGHWIDRWDKILLCEDKNCSICGYLAQTKHNYCPNCGADMREVEE